MKASFMWKRQIYGLQQRVKFFGLHWKMSAAIQTFPDIFRDEREWIGTVWWPEVLKWKSICDCSPTCSKCSVNVCNWFRYFEEIVGYSAEPFKCKYVYVWICIVCDGFAFQAMSIIIGKMIMLKTMLTIECFILINKQVLFSLFSRNAYNFQFILLFFSSVWMKMRFLQRLFFDKEKLIIIFTLHNI